MGRNANGIYNLPEPPFVGHTPIVATPMNNNMNDIASALTMSIATSGQTAMGGQIKVSYGSASAPSYTFADDLNTGLYLHASTGKAIFVTGSSPVVEIDTNGAIDWQGAVTINGDADIRSLTYETLSAVDLDVTTSTNFSSQVVFQEVDFSAASYIFSDLYADGDIFVSNTGFVELSVFASSSVSVGSGNIRLYVESTWNLAWKDDANKGYRTDWYFIENASDNNDPILFVGPMIGFINEFYDEVLVLFNEATYNLSLRNDLIYWFEDIDENPLDRQLTSFYQFQDDDISTLGDVSTTDGFILDAAPGEVPIGLKIYLKAMEDGTTYYRINIVYLFNTTEGEPFETFIINSGVIAERPAYFVMDVDNSNGGANHFWKRYEYTLFARGILDAP